MGCKQSIPNVHYANGASRPSTATQKPAKRVTNYNKEMHYIFPIVGYDDCRGGGHGGGNYNCRGGGDGDGDCGGGGGDCGGCD